MIRIKALLAVGVLLAGCGSAVQDDSTLGQAIGRFSGAQVSDRFAVLEANNAPKFQIGVASQDVVAVLSLEHRKGDFDYWLSSDGAQLVLQRGMLHSTRGFGEGLLASELSEPLALVTRLQPGAVTRFHTYLNGNDEAITRSYRCVVSLGNLEDTALLSGPVQTQVMQEDCKSLDQAFTNFYWVTTSGREIVQSRQWAGPYLNDVSTRAVR